MAELREDSLLFSLKGLLKRERERVSDEADREFRRIEAEQLARLERERRGWEERERRRQEEEAQARCEGQHRRAAEARLEALRRAEVARARAEADVKARIEIEARCREHELMLEGIREKSGRRHSQQLAASFAAVALLFAAGGGTLYFGKIRPEQERARADYERLVFAERTRSERMQHLLEGSERQRSELFASLERTRRELAEAHALVAGPASPVRPKAAAGRRTKRTEVSDRRTPSSGCRDDSDPLNGCL